MSALSQTPAPGDRWSSWVMGIRHGGDTAFGRTVCGAIEHIRDHVLEGAHLSTGTTLVDVGSGDGLIAFGALERVGPSLRVVLTDISPALLEHARRKAVELGVEALCTFVQGSAERLEGIASGSADVLTTRAVLAYVDDKAAAFREFNRVLRKGGRISIGEPIFRDTALEIEALARVLAQRKPTDRDRPLRFLVRWKSAQYPSTLEEIAKAPITNFSERNLVALCEEAGFADIHLELHIDHRGKILTSWEVFLDYSPHPLAPTLREILASRFSEAERVEFEGYFRAQVESESGYDKEVSAYLTAVKV